MLAAAMESSRFADFVSQITAHSLPYFQPELLLIVGVTALLVLDLVLSKDKSRHLAWVAASVTLGALVLVVQSYGTDAHGLFGTLGPGDGLVNPMLIDSDFARFFQIVFLIGTAVTIVLAHCSKELEGRPMAEFYAILLTGLLGCFIMAEANNLLTVFIGIELLSIPSYILTGWIKKSRLGSEASLKYVIYGSVASGFMLYGFSLLYGMTGSLMLPKLADAFDGSINPYAVAIALLLSFAGYAYKLAAVPLHFWAPDVYQGAPTPVTAWLSVVSKAAGVAAFIRFVEACGLMRSDALPYPELLALIAAVTMTLGNLAALKQTDVKRMLAYSSIAHVGYILMGITAFGPLQGGGGEGWKAVAFYSVAYLVMNLGAFGCVVFAGNALSSNETSAYRGLGKRAPLLGICMTVFLISLLGLPPTAGFSGKFQLLFAAVNHGMLWLAVVAGLNTAISAYYYARLIKTMYFEDGDSEEPISVPVLGNSLIVLHVLGVLYLGVFFNSLLEIAQRISIG